MRPRALLCGAGTGCGEEGFSREDEKVQRCRQRGRRDPAEGAQEAGRACAPRELRRCLSCRVCYASGGRCGGEKGREKGIKARYRPTATRPLASPHFPPRPMPPPLASKAQEGRTSPERSAC